MKSAGARPPSESRGGRGTKGAPSRRGYREVTISTMVFGLLFGAILNAAITYSGLKIGFTISGSAIAAVVGFGVLRGLLRKGSILEVNIAQTVASGVNLPTGGVIFTVPVLFLLGMPFEFGDRTFWLLLAACTAGTILGIVFIIPVRKQMIDIDRLRFPSATAVAAILKSPGAGLAKTVVLLIGVVVAVAVYLPARLPSIRLDARLDQLDSLVSKGKITQAKAEITRDIDQWISLRQAPGELVERGRMLEQLRAIAASAPAGDPEVTTLRDRAADARKGSKYPDELCVGLAEAKDGTRDWDTLRSRRFGWATRPLWGYGDFGLLPRPDPPLAGDAADLQRYKEELERIDADSDGVADADKVDVGSLLGLPKQVQLVFAIAPFALGAGYLTGRAGLAVVAGGALAYFVVTPLAYSWNWLPQTVSSASAPGFAMANFNRPIGIGLLLGGAMMGIVLSLPAMVGATKSIISAGRSGGVRDELGIKTLVIAALAAMGLLFFASELIHAHSNIPTSGLLAGVSPTLRHLIVAAVGVIWMWFASIIIAQCVGMTDWSPISAMSLLTVVLVLALAGKDDVLGAVMIGASLCCAITCASDMMQDLRTGHLVGALPIRQQVVDLFACAIGPAISLCTIMLIVKANLIATGGAASIGPGTETAAAQAQTLKAVIQGVQGDSMPYALYGMGSVLGILLGLGAFSGLGVLIGLSMVLPFYFILTYGVGCLLNMLVGAIKGRTWAEEWGVPFCAGLIVGEALLALVINGFVLGMG